MGRSKQNSGPKYSVLDQVSATFLIVQSPFLKSTVDKVVVATMN